jgi:thiamine kinase-like enzyme
VIVLAGLHAGWWEGRGSANALGTPHTERSLRAMVGDIKAHLPAFLETVTDLPRSDREVLETVFNSPLRPWFRLTDQRDLTLIHGDAHTWNFLFPRSGSGAPYLIDWQTWHTDVGARDLAFMMALHWDRPVRQQLERPLLELYHRELMQRGITGYSFEELLLDYRRCVVRNLTFPVIYWSRGFPRERWRYRLDCALAAFHDFNCTELL